MMKPGRLLSIALLVGVAFDGGALARPGVAPTKRVPPRSSYGDRNPLLHYTSEKLPRLTKDFSGRSLLDSGRDLKFSGDGDKLVYVSKNEDIERVKAKILAGLSPAETARIKIEVLPESLKKIDPRGALYLPHPYGVPTENGRFLEMYGWDSLFFGKQLKSREGVGKTIVSRDHFELLKGMTENHLYEIEHYGGKVLNANAGWSIGRSQPPVLTQMILDTYDEMVHLDGETKAKAWLDSTFDSAAAYHTYWTSGKRMTKTGLSRYWDDLSGPGPEVVRAGNDEYQKVIDYFIAHPEKNPVTPRYPAGKYYNKNTGKLTAYFYKSDRAMRASGFDTSDRFGPFSAEAVNANPVCLNSLLYRMERDLAEMATLTGRGDAARWNREADARQTKINKLMWNEKEGLYFDHFVSTGQMSSYKFASTFFPLWTGVASPAQATRVLQNLSQFEAPGGILTSTQKTGHQWDAPFTWAPLVYVAVSGLRNYARQDSEFERAANRITVNFLTMVGIELVRRGAMFEKYDGELKSAELTGLVNGYTSNEKGFGWTNGVATELWHSLPATDQISVLRAMGRAARERRPENASGAHPPP